jgi:hypothetical protein
MTKCHQTFVGNEGNTVWLIAEPNLRHRGESGRTGFDEGLSVGRYSPLAA